MTKKTLKGFVASINIDYVFTGLTLNELTGKLNDKVEQIIKENPQFSDLYVSDCFGETEISGTREETDKEYNARIKQESRKVLTKEEKERKEWARLNKKFGAK